MAVWCCVLGGGYYCDLLSGLVQVQGLEQLYKDPHILLFSD